MFKARSIVLFALLAVALLLSASMKTWFDEPVHAAPPAASSNTKATAAQETTPIDQATASAATVPVRTVAYQPPRSSQKRPNILFIMGDDVGWFNIGAYHQGIMSGRTPNLDALARQGMRFTD